ncbi:putative ribonuclease H-like domain-containing protein [Tanacetum coccineum]
MAYSSTSSNSEVSTDSKCSSSCLEKVKFLKEQNEQLLKDLRTSKLNVIDYKTGLESIEARLLVYKKNESVYEEDIKIVDKYKTGLGYNVVLPPYTGNFMPPKLDLSFSGLEEFTSEPIVIKHVVENSEAKASEAKPKAVRKNNGAPIIEDWVSDNEEDDVPQAKSEKKTFKPSFAKMEFVKPKQQEKTARKTLNHVKQNRKNIHIPRGNQRIWNNMMSQRLGSNFEMFNKSCYVCGSFDHLQLAARPKAVVNAVKGNNVNVVKASTCWVWKPKTKVLDHVSKHNSASITLKKFDYVDGNPQIDLQDQGVIDSGCSGHMTGNMSCLTDYEEIDGGYVAFGGNPKGGKIISRGTIKTGNLDFENVYFVKVLKFNLFSVSQMCDKKNIVLFNDTECIVLSPNFKLTDESHVLLKVPRKNNMYSVDLKNIVPKEGLTCLFAKVTSDESKLWHRRLGHINFKTMNKLVKGNLVRGLPSKLFEIYQTCVSCQKGKQHRASCKSKTVSLISKPLHMLHIDLFGPTFVKSFMKKMYCLVVTDDYSRFSWVFFLAAKDETSGILKSFITRVENLIDQRVKVIRCDNGTEFKNKEMNQFCERKCIKREFSVARTPQQNRVAKRKNGTLIEAAKTMLADSKLPTTFWAEVVNTACYVQNRFEPNWLFDIDALTKSMNYKPVIAGNQSNGNAGTKACDDAGKARMETVAGKDYIMLPLWTVDPPFSQSSKSSQDDGSKPSSDDEKKVDEDPRKDSKSIDQEKDDNVNSTNNVNAASINKVNADGGNTSIKLLDDASLLALEDIVYSDDDEDVGTEADMNNLDAFMPVSPIPTTRVHKDHPVEQIIKYLNSAPQTRRMTKNLEEHVEPKKVIQALEDPSKIEAIWMLSGKIEEEVYVCQPPGFEDPDFPNRVYKVEKILYGLHQAPKAWYETLSTYLLDNGFQRGKIDKTLFIRRDKGDILLVQVYVDNIIFGSTKKSLCTEFEKTMQKKFQISSMGELTFFLGLQTASTPMETQKLLLKDEDGEEVDVHLYRSIIGSLMYLTSSRHDIMFAVYACARYQVNPKVSHLHAIKRIFRYLKGQPKFGLWYTKDSPFDLVAYTDSDYAGFWATVKVKIVNGEVQLQALVDGKKVIITESTVRRDLHLEDAEGVDCLPNATIFEHLTLMGSRRPKRKDTEVPQPSGPTDNVADEALYEEMGDSLERVATTTTSLDAEQDRGNINKTQSKATLNKPSSLGTSSGSGPKSQETIGDTITQTGFKNVSKTSNDSLLIGVNTPRILDLENTKTAQAQEITSLKLRVKRLKNKGGSRTYGLKRLYKVGRSAKVISSNEASLGDQEDASKQGRIADIDADTESIRRIQDMESI